MKAPIAQDPHRALPRRTRYVIVRAVLLYATFAALWILLSDKLAVLLFPDPAAQQIAGTVKGLLFVTVTALMLLVFLLRLAASGERSGTAAEESGPGGMAPRSRRHLIIGSIAVLSVAIAVFGIGSLLQSWNAHRQVAHRQLAAVAELKLAQLEGWLAERLGDARLARSAQTFSEQLPLWIGRGDREAQARLLAYLEELRATYRYRSVLLCDPQGGIILQAGDLGHPLGDELRVTVRHAVADGQTRMTGLFRMAHPVPEHAHLDLVAPLPPRPGQGPAAAVVLRADLDTTLYAFLQAWPLPSASAETLLVRRDGDAVLFLNNLRHLPDAALKLRRPLTEGRLLAVQALAPGHRPGSLLEGVDYRGAAVLGVARPVAGTDWWLVAKVDRDEIFGEARKDTLWIVLGSLVFWAAAVALVMLLLERRELQHAERQRGEQAERIRALSLLAAIADGSSDAIFAKDGGGRYMLFNQAAARFTGKSEAEVLGRDDTVLFSAAQAAEIHANDRRAMEAERPQSYEETLDTPGGRRTFLAVKGPLRDEAGRVIGMFGIARDISERAQAETALRRSNEELQRFNRAMVGRELDMLRLKREVNALSAALGRPAPYDLAFLDAGAPSATGLAGPLPEGGA